MPPILKTSCQSQSSHTLTRRTLLGLGAAGIVASAIRPLTVLSDEPLDEKEKALAMLDQKIEELKKNSKEKKTVELLELFREEFSEHGEVWDEQPHPAATMYDFDEEDGNCILKAMYPFMHPGFINAHWNSRNVPHVVESFISICLKEAVYFGEYKNNPELVINKLYTSLQFLKKLAALPNAIPNKDQFINLAKDKDLVESAKRHIASLAHWESMAYKVQLEFLHRQGWNTNACEKMKQDKAIHQNNFLKNSFLSNLYRMGFVSQEGVLDEGNFLRTVVRNMLFASEQQHDPQNSLLGSPLRTAFHIILAGQDEYKNTTDTIELFDKKANLFDFIYDEKYWKTKQIV